ncbi:hypothetical protein [Mesorhizobium silamurunense]|uniref:hypothetical protein n=1 Tax=Mesorhizobium silamurunense TaxID=499528 RepID=UPI00177DAD7A|nr:hypothetical protein [Mesorhizobium silamurunense]
MTVSDCGFTPHDIGCPDTLKAILVAWHEPTPKVRTRDHYPVGSYGLVFAGGGREGALWGGGSTSFQVPMLAHGVRRVLALAEPGMSVQVSAHPELYAHVGPAGYIWAAKRRAGRAADGKPYAAYQTLLEVATALREGRWGFRPLVTKGSLHPGTKEATRLAKGPAYDAALRYRRENVPSFARAEPGTAVEYVEPASHSVLVEGP